MSGGHFDYKQYVIDDIADSIDRYVKGIELNDCEVEDYIIDHDYLDDEAKAYIREHKRTMPNEYGYNREVIGQMNHAVWLLRRAAIYAQRIDWLLSGDDSEDSFLSRLKEDINILLVKSLE